MIEFSQVSKQYAGGQMALSEISLQLNRGDMVFLTGHSGAGKSTVLRLLTLLERPSQGQISVFNKPLHTLPSRLIPYYRRQLGVVYQDHQLLFDRTVFDNVALPLHITGMPPQDIARRVRAALDKVGLLRKEKDRPIQLSSGEQQRVGIARAVVNKPLILLADEPTGNLDPGLSQDIMKLFAEFNRVGTTVLIASHDLSLIARLPYTVVSLHQGRRMASGQSDAATAESPWPNR